MKWQLYHGDYLKHMRDVADNSVDAVITDPPYGTTDLPWDVKIDWPRFWLEVNRVCKPNAVVVLFSQQALTTDLIVSNSKAFRYELIWHKSQAVGWLNCRNRPLRAHENILIFVNSFRKSTYNPQMLLGLRPYQTKPGGLVQHYRKPRLRSKRSEFERSQRYPRTVLTFSRDIPSVHPSQKPLALMEWLVRTYTNKDDLVLDPFMGSGTTGIASLATGRRFIGIEYEEKYFTIARNRLSTIEPVGIEAEIKPFITHA